LYFSGRHNDQAIAISNNDVARINRGSAENDRDINLAGLEFIRSLDAKSACECRKTHIDNGVSVANRTVNNETCNAELLSGEGQQIAPWACVYKAFCVNDQHVAWPGFGKGIVDREVVAWTAVDGQRGTGEPEGRINWADCGVDRALLTLCLMDGRGSKGFKDLKVFRADTHAGSCELQICYVLRGASAAAVQTDSLTADASDAGVGVSLASSIAGTKKTKNIVSSCSEHDIFVVYNRSMDTRYLQCFLKVVESGSIAEAARQLDLSPTTVAAQIRALELELGAEVLARSGRVVRPTTAGVKVLEKARSIVRDTRELLVLANNEASVREFRLGIFPSAIPSLLPIVLSKLYADHPELNVFATPGYSPDLFAKVASGELDAAIVVEHQVGIPKTCEWQVLLEEPLVVVAHNEISAGRDPHDVLRNEPFLRYDRRVWGGRLADRYLREQGIKPRERLEIDGLAVIASLIKHRLGVSLLPDWSAMWEDGGSLVRIPLPGEPPVRRVGFIWTRQGPRAGLAEIVLSEATRYLKR
jgi:DNA-binding transcriptional LysR family regulator